MIPIRFFRPDGIGSHLIFFLVVSVAFNDIFAYFGGRRFGKHPLSKLSPKKTIEGMCFGLLGSSVIGFLAYHYGYTRGASIDNVIYLVIACNLASQSGDLFESLLKRYAGVKDSGTIMPGHGGVLDRIDGLLFSAPVFHCLYSAYIL